MASVAAGSVAGRAVLGRGGRCEQGAGPREWWLAGWLPSKIGQTLVIEAIKPWAVAARGTAQDSHRRAPIPQLTGEAYGRLQGRFTLTKMLEAYISVYEWLSAPAGGARGEAAARQ